jgi:hypothetical protein
MSRPGRNTCTAVPFPRHAKTNALGLRDRRLAEQTVRWNVKIGQHSASEQGVHDFNEPVFALAVSTKRPRLLVGSYFTHVFAIKASGRDH